MFWGVLQLYIIVLDDHENVHHKMKDSYNLIVLLLCCKTKLWCDFFCCITGTWQWHTKTHIHPMWISISRRETASFISSCTYERVSFAWDQLGAAVAFKALPYEAPALHFSLDWSWRTWLDSIISEKKVSCFCWFEKLCVYLLVCFILDQFV